MNQEIPGGPPRRIIDDKVLQRMQGLMGFAPDSFVRWTPEPFLELPKECWPIVYVRPFDATSQKAIREKALAKGLDDEAMRQILTQAIPGWENMLDLGALVRGDLITIPFSAEAIADPVRFPEQMLALAFAKARELTWGISEEEKEALELLPLPASERSSNPVQSADATPT